MIAMSSAVTPLSVDMLKTILESQNTDVLLIDCRSFLAFNAGHVRSAHNIHCPPIVKRRSGGSLPLENVIRCQATRHKLLSQGFHTVVVYDERTLCLTDLPEDSNMCLVLKSLREETDMQGVCFIEGGYEAFRCRCLHLCDSPQLPGQDSRCSSLPCLSSSSTSSLLYSNSESTSHPCRYNPRCDQMDPVQVLPWLYLGSARHASQVRRLTELGISAVLNVSSLCDPSSPLANLIYKKITVDDNTSSDIMCSFPEAIEFIEKVRVSQGKVLVHCMAGVSRSATICIAYLMYQQHLDLEKAFDYLRSRRSVIAPNLFFMQQLREFETQLLPNKAAGQSTPVQNVSSNSSSSSSPCFSCPSLLELSANDSTKSKPSSWPLTPCTKQAAFLFDVPLTPVVGSSLCHSPLVSSPS